MSQISADNTGDAQQFEKDIEACEQMRLDSIRSQDKLVITLSSGALALSLTMYDKIFIGAYPEMLVITWTLYFISLSSTLLSFVTAQVAFDEQIICYTALKNKEKPNPKRFMKFNDLTVMLNNISLYIFLIASFSLITFASLNLLKGN